MAIMARARGTGRLFLSVLPYFVLTAAAGFAGAAVFGLIASAGAGLPTLTRSLIVVVAVAVAWLAGARSARPWQRDVETPLSWLQQPGLRVALWNGVALGTGFATRVGFWLWWSLPVMSFALAEVPLGLSIGALYGASRVAISSLLVVEPRLRRLAVERRRAVVLADILFFASLGLVLALVSTTLATSLTEIE